MYIHASVDTDDDTTHLLCTSKGKGSNHAILRFNSFYDGYLPCDPKTPWTYTGLISDSFDLVF